LDDEDREGYLAFLERYSREHGMEIWAWCAMSNHVHMLVWPHVRDSLGLALGLAHGKYAQWLNARHQMSGHVWANRFYSTPLDGEHLWAAVRYVELNPVRAGLVGRAEQYAWSSAGVHAVLCDNRNSGRGGLLWTPRPFPGHLTQTGWAEWLGAGLGDSAIERLRRDTMTGRPCGGADFMERLERELNRILRPQKVGRKRQTPEDAPQIPDLFGGVEL
jgi:putative transposase